MNNAESDIFHQSRKIFENRKFEFGRPTADVLTRQSRSGPGPVQIARTIDREPDSTGSQPRFSPDGRTQPEVTNQIPTTIQAGKSNGNSGSGIMGSRDDELMHRSLLKTRTTQSVAVSSSASAFPLYGRTGRTASDHATTYSHVVVKHNVGHQDAKTIGAGAQRIERDSVLKSIETTASELRQPVPGAAVTAPKSTTSESYRDRALNSSNIARSPAWSPMVRPFLNPGIGDNGSRPPGAMPNTNQVRAKNRAPTTLGKIDTESSSISKSTLGGHATNKDPPDGDVSVAPHRGSIGTSDDLDQAKDSSGVAGELWLDTVSLRNWFQAYLASELAQSSRATNQSNAAF